MTWGLGPESSDQSISATGLTIWTSGAVPGEPEFTIVRTRGFFEVGLASATAAQDGFFGAIGIGIVTAKAFAIGGTAMPGPLTEIDWDGWLFHSFFDVRMLSGTHADGVNAVSAHQRIEIDSKAMRKISTEEILVGVTEVTESGTGVIETHADCRVLVKLG